MRRSSGDCTGERPLLVTASLQAHFPFHVWDWRTGSEVARLSLQREESGRLLFAPDGSLLATATDLGVSLWDTATWEPAHALGGHGPVRDLAFSPDGGLLGTVGHTDRVLVWDAHAGRLRGEFCWRPGDVPGAVAFAPDGLTAAAAYPDAVVLWDVG